MPVPISRICSGRWISRIMRRKLSISLRMIGTSSASACLRSASKNGFASLSRECRYAVIRSFVTMMLDYKRKAPRFEVLFKNKSVSENFHQSSSIVPSE